MFQFSLLFSAWGDGQQKIICKIHGENKKDLHKHVILEQPIVFFLSLAILFCLFQALQETVKEKGDCRNNTTLKIHFFGSRGTGQLTFSQFSKYVT